MAFQFNRLIDLSGPKGWIKKTGYFHTGTGTFDRTFLPPLAFLPSLLLNIEIWLTWKWRESQFSLFSFLFFSFCLRKHSRADLLFRWGASGSVSDVENGLILMTWLSRVIWNCEIKGAIQSHLTISKCDPGDPFNQECSFKNGTCLFHILLIT